MGRRALTRARGGRAALATAVVAAAAAAAGALALDRLPLPETFGLAPSQVIEYRDGAVMHVFLSPDERWRMPVDANAVDPRYVAALLHVEDERFPWHPGVDPIAVARAALSNARAGHVVSGASTLTMQLARMLEPRPCTLAAKARALRALALERRLTKDEVLGRYLERIPFGGNLEGVETAAWSYFGHGARFLSDAEIATLLAVPQDPSHRAPGGDHGATLRGARDAIARRLATRDGDAAVARVPAALGPVPERVRPLPRDAPSTARWLAAQRPGMRRVRSTLDRDVQRTAERVLAAARRTSRADGITNAAVVVIDPASAEVRALAGTFDFWDEAHGAQIPAFDRARSPGSALKPLLYALAIDRGLVLPTFLVPDVPRRYGTYAPENNDHAHRGVVRLEDALTSSLNVPFVDLLARVGVDPFLAALGRMEVTSLVAEPGHYGLSAAVGGVELTPLELAAVYCTLARGGSFEPLTWLADQPPRGGERIVSAGAVHLTERALARRDRPDFPARRRLSGRTTGIRWKTGTSFGNRDAWAAGYDDQHVAVVWLGNLDRTPSAALTGAGAAGPVLFDLLEALADARPATRAGGRPAELTEVEVCALSGYLPGRACPRRVRTLALERRVPTERCPYHVELDVDDETGLTLTKPCRAGRSWHVEPFVVWPATVARFLDDDHRRVAGPPALLPGCPATSHGAGPRIVAPPRGYTALLIPGIPPERQQIALEAEVEGTPQTLSWFVDGAHLATGTSGARHWWTPEPGEHQIVVISEDGAEDRQVLRVRGG